MATGGKMEDVIARLLEGGREGGLWAGDDWKIAEFMRGLYLYVPKSCEFSVADNLLNAYKSLVGWSVAFASTETVGLLGAGAQDGHLDFPTQLLNSILTKEKSRAIHSLI